MKRSLVAIAAICVALVCAAVAQAAFDSGRYKGKTVKGKTRVAFAVGKCRTGDKCAGEGDPAPGVKAITRFKFYRLRLRCTDGDRISVGTRKRPFSSGSDRLTVLPNGKFAFTVSYQNGGKWTARGRIKGNKARGTLSMVVRFDSDTGQASPNGDVRCASGKRKFRARHPRR
jgi:hypothetical protein